MFKRVKSLQTHKKYIPVGTIIICPNNHKIGMFVTDLFSGDVIRTSMVDFVKGQEKLPGESPTCTICKEPYIRGLFAHEVHLQNSGWY